MKNKYNTPIYDRCLQNLGYQKFETHPIYYRRVNNDRFEVNFNTDFNSYQLLEEQWVKDKKITEQDFQNRLKSSFERTSCKTVCSKLTYEILLALTADFYYHNRDMKKHQVYKKEYEKLTAKTY